MHSSARCAELPPIIPAARHASTNDGDRNRPARAVSTGALREGGTCTPGGVGAGEGDLLGYPIRLFLAERLTGALVSVFKICPIIEQVACYRMGHGKHHSKQYNLPDFDSYLGLKLRGFHSVLDVFVLWGECWAKADRHY